MGDNPGGGTGNQLTRATIIVAGVAALVASLLSFVAIWLQLKNYRKPLLQRYVVRILLMVPIYSASSWASIVSLQAAFYLDPIRDIYEAFTIYTFFQLLINFIGGERALIIMMHGRPPVHHPWPLDRCLSKVDISDPHTFLAVKRGILQYAWLKPILSIATIAMKLTDTYEEGYLGLKSGYLWVGILYNMSVTLSLYSLAMFWVCMAQDLKPFRPVPKFLCIKLIIFASYWQGFFLSILQWLGAIPNNVPGYTPDNLAAAIQDSLICFEMPIFAVAHWYAFSWHDYADVTISAARMPVKYAFRDAFGIRDLIEDSKETFRGSSYGYRSFDSGDNVLAHEESASRVARQMEGLRYQRGGKSKYWIPKPGDVSSRTPLLYGTIGSSSHIRNGLDEYQATEGSEDPTIDPEDERLFTSARALEYGDWNYPVVTAHEAPRDLRLHQEPNVISTATNRKLLHPTKHHKARRQRKIERTLDKGKHRTSSTGGRTSKSPSRAPVLEGRLESTSGADSKKLDRSQLVDLVVEDEEEEETERIRARKEGGPAWNKAEPKYFVKTYDDEEQGKAIRIGFEPSKIKITSESEFAVGGDEDEDESGGSSKRSPDYGDINEEGNPWAASNGQP